MNWLLLIGVVCLVISIIKQLGLFFGGLVIIFLAVLIELW